MYNLCCTLYNIGCTMYICFVQCSVIHYSATWCAAWTLMLTHRHAPPIQGNAPHPSPTSHSHSHHSLSHISFPLEIHDIPHHFAHSAGCTITPPPTYLSANPYQPPFLAWTSGRIPTKWSLSLPPGGRDCWLPHDSGAGLCWQHVGGVGSTTTTTTHRHLVC